MKLILIRSSQLLFYKMKSKKTIRTWWQIQLQFDTITMSSGRIQYNEKKKLQESSYFTHLDENCQLLLQKNALSAFLKGGGDRFTTNNNLLIIQYLHYMQCGLLALLIILYLQGEFWLTILILCPCDLLLQSTYNAGQWEPRLWPWAQPDLNYAAPEYILSRSCDLSSDMFSFGVLIYSIYNKGRPPFDSDNNMTAFKRNVEQVISIN